MNWPISLNLGRREDQLGRRNQVAQRNAGIERRNGNVEIAAAALRGARRGLRFGLDQQRREVGRGDLDSAKHQLGHEHRAVDDDDLRAVGQCDDEIAADDVDVVEVDAGGQGDHAVGTGNDPLRIVGDLELGAAA